MDILELTRKETSPGETIGILMVNKKLFGVVLEPRKAQNKKDISCIPTGQYFCKKYFSIKHKCACLALYNVPGRSYISMHGGNVSENTKGCLLIGSYTGYLQGKRAILKSMAALKTLIGMVGETCQLTIKEDF